MRSVFIKCTASLQIISYILLDIKFNVPIEKWGVIVSNPPE